MSEEMRALLESYPCINRRGKWTDVGKIIDIDDMNKKWIKSAINYLEKNVKLAHAYSQTTEDEKEVARVIDEKIEEFETYL